MANAQKEDNIFDEIADASEEPEVIVTSDEPIDIEAEAAAFAAADAGESLDASDEIPAGVEAIIQERDELKDRLLRTMADAENTRKRGERDRREAEQYGGAKLARDMLPVYDNLKRALDAAGDDVSESEKAVLEGVELTMRELLNIFSKHGIQLIAPEEGETFDPQMHQAMFEAPVPGTKKGAIIQVMAEGFMLHDRLLRPAQVGVSSAT
ncbi:MAG: nucleotide exchange factor GrpE [Dinoroseobacter sp.]|nr:nucleotide exchange factor GrpE [Dinoroseobacter sp.]